ncbi:MAG: hypothetical protein HFJ75_00220 [Eggerthellaceae bacterium]|nr:hypothetical protein [Eggerthellaceae bacterium]
MFSYPAELDAIDELLAEYEESGANGEGCRASLLTPYGKGSYEEYYSELEGYADKYKEIDPGLADALLMLRDAVKALNVKEHWSVVRYVGEGHGAGFGLTQGRCYYWPCSAERPEYEGVIDDDEFTSYLYPCDADCWEILEDPTGMAARALSGDAGAAHG